MNRLRSILAAAVLVGAVAVGQAASTELKSIDIPAGDLTVALELLAKQSGVEVVYRPEQLKGLQTKGVQGALSSKEAVTKLLEGTALTLRVDRSGVMLITEAGKVGLGVGSGVLMGPEQVRLAEGKQNSTNPDTGVAKQEDNTQNARGQASAGPVTKDCSLPENRKSADCKLEELDVRGIPEILVTGKKGHFSFNADIIRSEDDIQPYVVLDRKQIEQSGATDIGDLLRTHLSMNYVPQSNAQTQALGGNQSQIALRGLSSSQTLVLIDGRRVGAVGYLGGDAQPDLNGIPLSAIERIDILPSTASGIYGGAATGGVVNVILRRDYSGIETSVGYSDSFAGGGNQRRVNVNGGFNFNGGRTSVLVSGSYADQASLLTRERTYIQQRYDASIAATTSDSPTDTSSPPLGSTANIRSSNGALLTLKNGTPLNSRITSVPEGYAGVASDNGAAFVSQAGKFNTQLSNTAQAVGGGQRGLLNGPIVAAGDISLQHKFSSAVSAFFEVAQSRNDGDVPVNSFSSIYRIAATSAANPFSQPIVITTPAVGGDLATRVYSSNRRALAGLMVDLPAAWRAEFDYSHTRSMFESFTPGGTLSAAQQTAITGGTVNVLRDTSIYPITLFADSANQAAAHLVPAHGIEQSATMRIAGNVGTLPAGAPSLTTFVERRRTDLSESAVVQGSPGTSVPTETRYSDGSQNVTSMYIEANVPIVGSPNSVTGVEALDFQIAARYEAYTATGVAPVATVALTGRSSGKEHSVDPTFGLRFQPVRGVTFRGSYGSGFLPPTMSQLQIALPSQFPNFFGVRDPKRGNELVGTISLQSGGNPDLEPEKSHGVSAGIIFEPSYVRNLRFSADWSRIDKRNNILGLTFMQDTVNQEDLLPGVIQRGAVSPGDPFGMGKIVGVDGRLRNVTRGQYRSLDLALAYALLTDRAGNWEFEARGTRLFEAAEQNSILSPLVERGGTFQAPHWNGNATLAWSRRGVRVGWSAQFLGPYFVNSSHSFSVRQGSATVPSVAYHDLFGSYAIKEPRLGLGLTNLEILGGIRNVFDMKPRYSIVGSYDSDPWGSPMLASYYVTVRASF